MATKIFIDLSKYTEVLADRMAAIVNAEVWKNARNNVAVDTGRLRTSLTTAKLSKGHYETSAQTPYALAQEYGRPDLAKYTFTPYMRPTAKQATEIGKLNQFLKEAEATAKQRAKI